MKLTTAQVYGFAKQAGFKGLGAIMITAITAAESSNHTDSIGDVNLTEPGEKSVGLTQINYRPSRDRGVAVRDPVANLDPLTNLQHAYAISHQGTKWTPWSTYTNGAYVKFLGGARKVAGQPDVPLPSVVTGTGGAGGATGAGGTATAEQTGWLGDLWGAATGPALGWIGDGVSKAISKEAGSILAGVRGIALQMAFIGGGLALVVLGAREAVAPAVNKAKDKVTEKAGQAAQVAAVAAV